MLHASWHCQTSNTVQLHKSSSSSNVVMSPAFNPGTGNNRTVNGFFNRYAIVPTSLDNAQIWATVVLPGIGTCPHSRKHRNTVSMDQVIQACLCKQLELHHKYNPHLPPNQQIARTVSNPMLKNKESLNGIVETIERNNTSDMILTKDPTTTQFRTQQRRLLTHTRPNTSINVECRTALGRPLPPTPHPPTPQTSTH